MDGDDEELHDQLCEQRDAICNDKGGIRAAQNVALARVSTWIMEQCASPDASEAVEADLKNVPKRKAAHLAHLARKHSLQTAPDAMPVPVVGQRTHTQAPNAHAHNAPI